MNRFVSPRILGLLGACLALSGPVASAALYSVLHEFAGTPSDGNLPYWSVPTIDGSTIYSGTVQGGTWNCGTVFKVGTDGTGYTLVHQFDEFNRWPDPFDGGAFAYSSPIIAGSVLYGTTGGGWPGAGGSVYRVNTNGTGFTKLYTWNPDDTSTGENASAAPVLIGSTLYGTTINGGTSDRGVIYKVMTNGTGFAVLHHFAGDASDGRFVTGGLTPAGSVLYGMAVAGGDTDGGIIYKIGTDGSGFSVLHEFAGGSNDGKSPYGNLLLVGSTLYGMTVAGGASNEGIVFRMDTDGTGFTLLHEFSGGPSDGSGPRGSLLLDGSTLYGMTYSGGDSNLGVVFQMNLDGTSFALLHEFAGGATDGRNPLGSLALANGKFFGLTSGGGDNDGGVLFSLSTVPEPSIIVLVMLGSLGLLGWHRRR